MLIKGNINTFYIPMLKFTVNKKCCNLLEVGSHGIQTVGLA